MPFGKSKRCLKVSRNASFAEHFAATVQDSVQGFIHKLEVDFSAYDPNNYANALRILAKEGNDVRAFEEFGTGEQQVLLMAFAKAFMQTFGSDSIVLVLEEPEAHLHPLAQRWLKEYIYDLCDSGIQVVISTHSADFVDPGTWREQCEYGKTVRALPMLSNCLPKTWLTSA
ncbi:ATP-dependent nuclease [Collinsella ureilytica]